MKTQLMFLLISVGFASSIVSAAPPSTAFDTKRVQNETDSEAG